MTLLTACAAALLFALGAALAWQPVHDMDLPMHVAAGRWILEHGEVPSSDPFSYTAPGARWVDHEWLSQVVFALVERHAGIEGLKALGALLVGGGAALWFFAFRRSGGLASSLALALLTLLLFEHRVHVRPHVGSFVAEAIFFLALSRPPRALWSRALLAASFVFWVQVHGGWVLVPLAFAAGVPMALLFGGAARRAGALRCAALALAALALACLNPEGPIAVTTTFRVGEVSALIKEWWPVHRLGETFVDKQVLTYLFAPVSVAALFLCRRERPELLGMVLVSLALAVSSNRFIYLLPTGAALLRSRLPGWFEARIAPMAALVLALALSVKAFQKWRALATKPGGVAAEFLDGRFPEEAVDLLVESGFRGTVLAPPAWGGYLLYRLGERVKVAIDGRVEVYGLELARQMLLLKGEGGKEIVARFPADLVLVPAGLLGPTPPPGYRIVPRPGIAQLFLADRPEHEELRRKMLGAR